MQPRPAFRRRTWDNGDRTVLVNPNLGGITMGWNLHHTAQDKHLQLAKAVFHRVILDRMSECGAPSQRVISGGGVPQNNPVLNQVHANVWVRPVLVPSSKVTGVGSAIFAFLAAKTFRTMEEAQRQICPAHSKFSPHPDENRVYDELYPIYCRIYFDLGKTGKDSHFGDVLPKRIQVARTKS